MAANLPDAQAAPERHAAVSWVSTLCRQMNKLLVPRPQNPDLAVRRITLADAEEWAEYAALPEVTRQTSSTVASVDDLILMIDRSLSEDSASPVLFSVRLRTSGQYVATFGFHSIQPHNRTAEITYDVRPACWGLGIATDCCRAAVRWGFSERKWVRVQGTTQQGHLASQAVLLKAGFALEGKLRNFRMVRGAPCDYLMYAVIPDMLAADAS
jgi:RimJ/RimL family protein N-acetyltransferase